MAIGRTTASQVAFRHQSDTAHFQFSYGESRKGNASPIITRVGEGVIQHDVYLTAVARDPDRSDKYRDARAFAVADVYTNLSLGMKREQAYGAGVAFDWGTARQHVSIGSDIRYISEDRYSTSQRLRLVASALAESYSVSFPHIGKKIMVSESGSVIPAYGNAGALQARGIAKLTYPVTEKLSIGPSVTDDYLRNAPLAAKPNYLSATVSMSYIFGASSGS